MAEQYVDPAVSLAKFERELAEYRQQRDHYRRLGWMLVEAEFPRVVVIFAAAKLNPIAVILGVQFDYSNYDAEPPSVKLVKPLTGEPFKTKELPTHLNRSLPPRQVDMPGIPEQKMQFNQFQPYMQSYGPEEIPFLCIQGVREYHNHPAHSGDVWELHRGSGAGRLVRLLEVIYRYGIEPISGYNVQLVPQIGVNYGAPPA